MPTYTCNVDQNPLGYTHRIATYNYISENDSRTVTYGSIPAGDIDLHEDTTYQGVPAYNQYIPYANSNKVSNPDTWVSHQVHARYDCSAIPNTDVITNVELSQYLYNYLTTGQTTTVEFHAINWQYYSNVAGTGRGGTDKSNWKTSSNFNNLAITMNITPAMTMNQNNFTGNAAARSWINKGGWTYFAVTNRKFITGGFDGISTFLRFTPVGSSYLIITTTAGGGGSTTSQNGWGFLF